MTTPKWGKAEGLRRALVWSGRRLDALAALAAGFGTALAGALGLIKGETLTTATLGVLTVVALALLLERSLPLNTQRDLREARSEIQSVRATLAAGASPYYVMKDESVWDIRDRGASSTAVRTRLLHFNQDETRTVLDWLSGDGSSETSYDRGLSIRDFQHDGRKYKLVFLDRFYNHGDTLSFVTRRTATDSFPGNTERVAIEAVNKVDLLRLKVIWPEDRPPTGVWLRRTNAGGERVEKTDVTSSVRTEKGRGCYATEVQEPERGGRTTIEWDW